MAIHRLAGKFIPLHLLSYLTLHSEFLIRVILFFCNVHRSKTCRTLFDSAKRVSTVIPCGRVKELIICRKENNTYIGNCSIEIESSVRAFNPLRGNRSRRLN